MSYKVFISFKNLDAKGNPTRDSVIAAQLYRELKARGIARSFSVTRRCSAKPAPPEEPCPAGLSGGFSVIGGLWLLPACGSSAGEAAFPKTK